VNAAVNFIYGDKFFKEGDAIPDSLIPELDKHQNHVLDSYVEVDGSFEKIDDKRIEGWVEQRKTVEKRLQYHFGIEDTEESKKYNREELEMKSFSQLRKIGNTVGTKGRSKEELIGEILELQ
jgi:hypothetical protein